MTVTSGYFDALRIPLQAGRRFASADRLDGAPVVIIDAELVRRYWPAGDALSATSIQPAPSMPCGRSMRP